MKRLLRNGSPHRVFETRKCFIYFPVAMGSRNKTCFERRWCEIDAAIKRSMKELPE